MNKPKVGPTDYIQFLIASPVAVSGTEAARVHPAGAAGPAHDAFTRLLHRLEPEPDVLWAEAASQIDLHAGVLVLDDTTLDKPYARHIELVTRHWSGKHRAVVQGINLLTLLWTDGARIIPLDYRIYDKARDGLTKNDHFRALLERAHARGLEPEYVLFDSWYASLANLKAVRHYGWRWLTQLKGDRHVDPDGSGNRPLAQCAVEATGTRLHLKGYGFVTVFRIAPPDGSTEGQSSSSEHWATSEEAMQPAERAHLVELAWKIEQYHRGLKQHCAVERAQVRSARAQRNHIGLAIRAFVRLERHRIHTGISWYEAKTAIIRDAVRAYLAAPQICLEATA